MLNVLLVGAGGFLGSVARYLTGVLVRQNLSVSFPLATMTVNVVGCFLIGLVSCLAERQSLHPQVVLLLSVGCLGGFTTFSAFGMETVSLFRTGHAGMALLNIGANLIVGLASVGLGVLVGSR
jgi:CrcB protein